MHIKILPNTLEILVVKALPLNYSGISHASDPLYTSINPIG